jgi:hypothetical protein
LLKEPEGGPNRPKDVDILELKIERNSIEAEATQRNNQRIVKTEKTKKPISPYC